MLRWAVIFLIIALVAASATGYFIGDGTTKSIVNLLYKEAANAQPFSYV